MPKLACPCGYVHNLSPCPDDGWRTLRDRDYEDVMEARMRMGALHEGPPCAEREQALRQYAGVAGAWGWLYECPRCGRLLWRREGEERFRVFVPEP